MENKSIEDSISQIEKSRLDRISQSRKNSLGNDAIIKELEQRVREDEEAQLKELQGEDAPEESSESSKHLHHHHHHRHRHHHHHSSSSKKSKHSKSKHKKSKTWKKVSLAIGCVCLALIIGVISTIAYLLIDGKNQLKADDLNIKTPDFARLTNEDDTPYILYNKHKYTFKKNIINMLFMGVDKYTEEIETDENGEEMNGQADVLILMSLDSANNKASLINIPRDVIADVKIYSPMGDYMGMEKQQICLSYAYGTDKEESCVNTIDSVKSIFYNVPINTYYSLDLAGLPVINDSIGGVDVVSPETIGEFVKGEKYHLEGNEARDFVITRSHTESDANLVRNKRQRVYIESFMNKLIDQTKADFSTPIKLYNTVEQYSCTNLNPSKISFLAKEAVMGGIKYDILNVPVTVTQEGSHAENYIKEKEFYEMFLKVFYDEVK